MVYNHPTRCYNKHPLPKQDVRYYSHLRTKVWDYDAKQGRQRGSAYC